MAGVFPMEKENMKRKLIELSTPGEMLKEEFLDPMGITPYAPAKGIFVDPPRIDAIVKGRRKITAARMN